MSRMTTFTVALLACLGTSSWSMAEESPAAGQNSVPDRQVLANEKSKPLGLDMLSNQAVKTEGSTTAAVDEIEKALKKPVDLHFVDTPLSDAVDFCSEHLDINIRFDARGLTDAAVDSTAPVTFSTHKPITFESALRLILDEFDLTFMIQDEILQITSRERAAEVLTTKTYYVGDLVRGRYGRQKFAPLINVIESVQFDTWGGHGGPGSIIPFAEKFLSVNQTRDVHVDVSNLINDLRKQLKSRQAAESKATAGLFTRRYHLGSASGEQTADAIKKLIAPSTWQGDGGEGQICIVRRGKPTGELNEPASDVLLIRQTSDVLEQIAELLEQPPTNGMDGGLGGVSGTGGGMFRVLDRP